MDCAYIHYCGGYKYQLSRNFWIHIPIKGQEVITDYFTLTKDGLLTIHAGYAWDGPSGPTIDTPSFMRGSMVHDSLYQAMRLGLLPQACRKDADIILRNLCLEDGMWRVLAWWVYRAVRKFAAPAARPDHKKKIMVAPG